MFYFYCNIIIGIKSFMLCFLLSDLNEKSWWICKLWSKLVNQHERVYSALFTPLSYILMDKSSRINRTRDLMLMLLHFKTRPLTDSITQSCKNNCKNKFYSHAQCRTNSCHAKKQKAQHLSKYSSINYLLVIIKATMHHFLKWIIYHVTCYFLAGNHSYKASRLFWRILQREDPYF